MATVISQENEADAKAGRMAKVPLIIRGKIIEENWIEFHDRTSGNGFLSPDVSKYINAIPLNNPSDLMDYYDLSMKEIIDFLAELGRKLEMSKNDYLKEAFEMTKAASGLTEPILRGIYEKGLAKRLMRDQLEEIVEMNLGRDYVDGWVSKKLIDGRIGSVRAFGARAIHIVPGNSAGVAATTVLRNALTRSDAIVKSPSNDPITHAAVFRTAIDIDPSHPIVKHLTVGYWKGGDEAIEKILYSPRNVEKIIAWGGFNSVKHIAKYIQPGIELITLDPKLSSTIIGKEAFESDETMRKVAHLLALDFAGANQQGCANARVVYVQSGTDDEGIALAEKLGEYAYQAMMALPPYISTIPKVFDLELASELSALRLDDTYYSIIGGAENEGAVIVSKMDEPVDFAQSLGCRVANIVPIDDYETAIRSVSSSTQTIGIYPDTLKAQIRNRLAVHGAQRIVSLGFALSAMLVLPQDGMEPLRRMCRWVADEEADIATTPSSFAND
jgi:hypothetical protein